MSTPIQGINANHSQFHVKASSLSQSPVTKLIPNKDELTWSARFQELLEGQSQSDDINEASLRLIKEWGLDLRYPETLAMEEKGTRNQKILARNINQLRTNLDRIEKPSSGMRDWLCHLWNEALNHDPALLNLQQARKIYARVLCNKAALEFNQENHDMARAMYGTALRVQLGSDRERARMGTNSLVALREAEVSLRTIPAVLTGPLMISGCGCEDQNGTMPPPDMPPPDDNGDSNGLPDDPVDGPDSMTCLECHAPLFRGPGEGGSHPIGFEYPGGQGEFPEAEALFPLPLEEGKLVCLTCHFPHEEVAEGEYEKLLRADNEGGLCKTCHPQHEKHESQGDWQPTCRECHDVHDPENENLSLIARSILNRSLEEDRPVVFTSRSGANSFNDGDPAQNDGVCQACHTDTSYHLFDGSGLSHNEGTTCTVCHPHEEGFKPQGGNCDSCHGEPPDGSSFPNTAGAHAIHMAPGANAPGITNCNTCHAPVPSATHRNGQVNFATGIDTDCDGNIDFQETSVCHSCHSPSGPFDGVAEAKENWAAAAPVSCEGCHDSGNSTVRGVSAPPVAGDNDTFGYFLSKHGQSPAGIHCNDCHDDSLPHFDGQARTFFLDPERSASAFSQGYRLKDEGAYCQTCHTDYENHSPGGDWQPGCHECHDLHDRDNDNLSLISRAIWNRTLGEERPVIFTARSGTNSFNDGNSAENDGICQVCHTQTDYHRYDGSRGSHNRASDCTECHPHDEGFSPQAGACDSCHGQPPDGSGSPNRAGAHAIHMNSGPNSPQISNCNVCHTSGNSNAHRNGRVSFSSGSDSNGNGNIDLAETDVCHSCHSPEGPFDGVAEAKENWRSATAVSCESCHDTGSSIVKGVSAPPVAGDNETFGYFLSKHGQSPDSIDCTECHDESLPHFDGQARTFFLDPERSGLSFSQGYRLKSEWQFCQSCHAEVENHTTRWDWQPTCNECHSLHDADNDNLALIARSVFNRTLGEDRPVVFTALSGPNSFNDGDPAINDGLCQVCHTETDYHCYDGSGLSHNEGSTCNACHPHDEGFMPQEGGCDSCHGQPPDGSAFPNTAGAHAKHMIPGPNSPQITDCNVCHAPVDSGTHLNGQVSFASGVDANSNGNIELHETDVCHSCHSPNGPFDGVAEARQNWVSATAVACEGCHDTGDSTIMGVGAPPVAGNNQTWGFFANGHGRPFAELTCTECHDSDLPHFDGVARTYTFNSDDYAAEQSGLSYALGYRLRMVEGLVPLMIPAKINETFSPAFQPRDNAFRLCFDCHDADKIFDEDASDGIESNFKASLPNPPRDYSFALFGFDIERNQHVEHVLNYPPSFWDSDWRLATMPVGGESGLDSMITCASCHNVHGSSGAQGSTNEAMIRDGQLIGRMGYGFSYVIEDASGYPFVTSMGANRDNSVGAIFRNSTNDTCFSCHPDSPTPAESRYNAEGSGFGTYLEYYRPYQPR